MVTLGPSADGSSCHRHPSVGIDQPNPVPLRPRPSPNRRHLLPEPHQFSNKHYANGHLVSSIHRRNDGNNTPYFLIPTILVAGSMFLALPFDLFLVVTAASAASFCLHVYLDRQYHAEGSILARFAWFRRKQQLHFAHHRHANTNLAVIDFFWDRLLGTYQNPDMDVR